MPLDELTRDLEVLVVDDEPTVRELLLEYFTGLGFRVTGSEDGRGAITLLQRAWGRYGLVITDLNLPGADGFAVLQAARQLNPHCFVVIITGYASLDSAIRAVRVGAFDYLTKPFSLAQLDLILTRIRDRMAQQRGQQAPPAPISTAPSLPAAMPTASPVHKAAPLPLAVPQALLPPTAAAPPAHTRGAAPAVTAGTDASASPSPMPPPIVLADAVPHAGAGPTTSLDSTAPPVSGGQGPLIAEVVPPHLQYGGMASYNVAQRLGLLEAAFNRIEALLREQKR